MNAKTVSIEKREISINEIGVTEELLQVALILLVELLDSLANLGQGFNRGLHCLEFLLLGACAGLLEPLLVHCSSSLAAELRG